MAQAEATDPAAYPGVTVVSATKALMGDAVVDYSVFCMPEDGPRLAARPFPLRRALGVTGAPACGTADTRPSVLVLYPTVMGPIESESMTPAGSEAVVLAFAASMLARPAAAATAVAS